MFHIDAAKELHVKIGYTETLFERSISTGLPAQSSCNTGRMIIGGRLSCSPNNQGDSSHGGGYMLRRDNGTHATPDIMPIAHNAVRH